MTAAGPAEIRDLTREECDALLTRNSIGRVAFGQHDRVDIQPISYVSDGEWIFGRTSEGTKLAALLHRPWCAFETDSVTDLFNWSSVVVRGTFSILDPVVGSLHTYQRADRLLRTLVPGAFSVEDPAPHRHIVFGIFAHEITGRISTR